MFHAITTLTHTSKFLSLETSSTDTPILQKCPESYTMFQGREHYIKYLKLWTIYLIIPKELFQCRMKHIPS